MNKAELLEGYKIKDGRIVSPGQFEGERQYMPAMYQAYLDGFAYEYHAVRRTPYDGCLEVALTKEDRADYPELADRTHVKFVVDDNGFVCEVR